MSAEAKNLEAISNAIDQHNATCPFPVLRVRMSPYEVERLGWTEIRGLPIVPLDGMNTGSFRLECGKDGELEERSAEELRELDRERRELTPANVPGPERVPTGPGRVRAFGPDTILAAWEGPDGEEEVWQLDGVEFFRYPPR